MADKLTLKDGAKISGTIVGFEQNSFKVKTSYGFALVEKSKVASIRLVDAPEVALKEKSQGRLKRHVAAHASAPHKTASVSTRAAIATQDRAAKNKSGTLATAATARLNPATATTAAPSPAAKSATSVPPPIRSKKEPIREEVNGNTYINETYKFRMYKPPDWEILDGARSVLPGAIAAMGTDNQTTYLLVGQEQAVGSLGSAMIAMDTRLRGMLDSFQPLGQERIRVSGDPALESRFRGSTNQNNWSGVVVLVPHDARLYTIFGMTRGDDTLVQIEENVIHRTIASLQFIK